ncbi:gamma-aminobutyric acid receptor-associated protein-like 2 [Eptesicus fuscus]|uniref:gamma-aminobutyric acid receptor-associated protein-like 2 n=1 Tax=Eptesicus fuscus TaxID=29078 RepID=UPI0024042EDC|nr:gamma-aminobutyric acid receptor-associated protein-like 2 [Eptesicus fuscus]
MFREDHALAHRCVESAEIRAKHPHWGPVIVGKVSGSQRVDIDKRKDLVPSDLSVARSTRIVRTRVQLPSEKAVFPVDKTVPQASLTVGSLTRRKR